jgi:hypothetical protein
MTRLTACLVCGCTDEWACVGGCSRVLPGLCSTCVDEFPELLLAMKRVADASVAYRRLVDTHAQPRLSLLARRVVLTLAGEYGQLVARHRRLSDAIGYEQRDRRQVAPAAQPPIGEAG